MPGARYILPRVLNSSGQALWGDGSELRFVRIKAQRSLEAMDDNLPSEAKIVYLSPWDRVARRIRGRDGQLPKLEDLTQASLAQISELEAYQLVKQAGIEGALSSLAQLNEKQLTTLFDLESWQGDKFLVSDLLLWMDAFRLLSPESLNKAAKSMDSEALALLFKRRLWIAHKPNTERSDQEIIPDWLLATPESIEPLLETPDGRFIIAARNSDAEDELFDEDTPIEEEERHQILAFVQALYLAQDWEYVAGILRMAHDDMMVALTEDAFQFRNGRLEDFGLFSMEQALEVYALIDKSILKSEPQEDEATFVLETQLPSKYIDGLDNGFLGLALRGCPKIAFMRRLESELFWLTNKVLCADGIHPGDNDGIEVGLQKVSASLELALSYCPGIDRNDGVELFKSDTSKYDVDTAVERLQRISVESLFRLGYTLIAELNFRAKKILNHPGLGFMGLEALSSSSRSVFEALLEKYPRFSRVLLSWTSRPCEPKALTIPFSLESIESAELFKTHAQVDSVHWFLNEIEAMAVFAEEVGLWQEQFGQAVLPQTPEERDLEVRWATMLCLAALGLQVKVRPLKIDEVLSLIDRLGQAQQGRLWPNPEDVLSTITTQYPSFDVSLLGLCSIRILNQLAENWYSLIGKDSLDLRYVTGVLLELRSSNV